MTDIHRASSQTWEDEACAQLCRLIIDSNNGSMQQVIENRTDVLDLLTLQELSAPVDDLGLTLPFLAIYFDMPDILRYLHKRGVDLQKYCDPMEFGTPMFYAVSFIIIIFMYCQE